MGLLRGYVFVLALVAVAFAGCADSETPTGTGTGVEPPPVQATETTGGIRGVVVDQGIVPVEGATVTVKGADKTATTDGDGAFVFSGLEPGTYIVEASHPLYDRQQTNAEVVAGVSNPSALRIQLTRLVSQDPISETLRFDGYIVCSTNIQFVGYSEECGEGVGVPCSSPVMPCERIGRQPGSQPQIWFRTSYDAPKSIIVEQIWTPSVSVATGNTEDFYTRVSIDWFCDPFCGGDTIATVRSGSPLHLQAQSDKLDPREITPETDLSTFVYSGASNGVILQQPYEQFVTIAYGVEFPEGWSFIRGDERPF